ncbi:MAG: carbonic anhydrase [Deltaproteobacteria bacterium]|nr:carbonic anhydrase [Deltaproteobacteria bacterium]
MQKLIKGIHRFQADIFGKQRELFERLAKGQSPETLFITCSDSRIEPALITQTVPGDLFIIRNAGNLVPPHSSAPGGEEATIEFAVQVLGVKDIVICGHSHCGAVKALLDPSSLDELPMMRQWLTHADATAQIIKESYGHLAGDAKVSAAVAENVLTQLENLRTHPSVRAKTARGELNLHGWVYKFETGEVFAYDHEQGQFVPVRNVKPMPRPSIVVPESA